MIRLLILFCISSLLACNNQPANHPEESTPLVLNDGSKWKSDDITNKNVAELDSIVSRFTNHEPRRIDDFTALGNQLQTGLDKMISECRMQGAEHEALHKWMEPIIKNVSDLKKATDEKEASTLLDKISERLNIYHQYFE